MNYERWLCAVYLIVIVFFSTLAFSLYGRDKSAAATGKRRIKEKTLLGISAMGGALGAALGMVIFRHKLKKGYFTIAVTVSLLLQSGVGAALLTAALLG